MKDENALVDLSMDLAVEILDLVKLLKSNHETIVANQNWSQRNKRRCEYSRSTVCTQQS